MKARSRPARSAPPMTGLLACYLRLVERDERGEDPRFGRDPGAIQNADGVDLLSLREQLSLSVEERFVRLERQLSFLLELRGAAKR